MKRILITVSFGICAAMLAQTLGTGGTNLQAQEKNQSLTAADRLESEAEARRSKHDFKKAIELLAKALALREKELGPDHVEVARTAFALAESYFGTGNYLKAETQYRNVIRIKEKLGTNEYPDLRTLRRRLAGVLIAQDKCDEGIQIEEELGDFSPTVGIAQVGFLKPRAVKLVEPIRPKVFIPLPDVVIRVTFVVDETGKVISATASLGISPFTEAALDAARRSTFKPIYYKGKPVKMSGYIDYRFTRRLIDLP